MAKKQSNSKNTEMANLQKVRDLLLESDRQAMEDQLSRLEGRLVKEIERNQKETLRQIRELERTLRKEIEAVSREIGAEADERTAGDDTQQKQLEAAKKTLRGRIDRVEVESKQRARGIRQRITAVSKKMRDELAERDERLLSALQAEIESVGAHGTPKAQLSALFAEFAERLAQSE